MPEKRESRFRGGVVFALALAALVVVGLAASGAAGTDRDDDAEDRIVITGRVDVFEDETVGMVLIFDGNVVIDGKAEGDVVAFNGDVVVRGEVDDNVIATNGRATVEDGAEIGGDVRSSDRPRVAEGATVDGDVEKTNFADIFDAFSLGLLILWWIAVTVSTFVLGALFVALAPRAVRAGVKVARTSVGPAIGWGFFMLLGVPLISVLALVTLVGIPLGLLGFVATAFLAAVGYVTGMHFLGRIIVKAPARPYVAFLVGWAILRGADLVPVAGSLVTFAAALYGLGALTVAAWRAARAAPPVDANPTAPPPSAPATP